MQRPQEWLRQAELDLQAAADGRGAAYAPSRSPGVPVDVFVYTPEERAGWTKRFERAVKSGVVLYRRAS
jgi:hypothetical protein